MGNKYSTSNGKAIKSGSPVSSFFRTFFIAFILFVAIGTPVFSMMNKVAEIPILGTNDNPTLKDELPVIVNEDSPFFEAFKEKNRVNVLLLGVNAGLTDTIMVASFDMDAKHVDLISIPRDTYYHRDGFNSEAEKKINAAYRKNPVNTAKAVSELLLGMPINYYAVIKYEGVEKIVDSMGGVPMTIKKGGMYYKDPYDKPPLVIAIPEGERILNGKQAVQFLRYRKGYVEGDLGRVKAQQEFMKSAFRQSLGFDLPKVAKTVIQNVDSDLTLGMATKIASKAVGMSGDDITTYMLPNYPQPESPFYVIADAAKTADMINEIYSVTRKEEAKDTKETQ